MHVRMCVCLCVYLYICACLSMSAHVHVCIYMCLCGIVCALRRGCKVRVLQGMLECARLKNVERACVIYVSVLMWICVCSFSMPKSRYPEQLISQLHAHFLPPSLPSILLPSLIPLSPPHQTHSLPSHLADHEVIYVEQFRELLHGQVALYGTIRVIPCSQIIR